MRSSDPDAALYWLARMLEGARTGSIAARRLVRMAIEDIGLADPRRWNRRWPAGRRCISWASPKATRALAQAALYLAVAPKSDAAYRALNEAR